MQYIQKISKKTPRKTKQNKIVNKKKTNELYNK